MAPRRVQHDLPGGRVLQPRLHVACRMGHPLDADEILKSQLSFGDLLRSWGSACSRLNPFGTTGSRFPVSSTSGNSANTSG